MATTTELALYQGANRLPTAGIATAGDREKSFLSARRHTRLVKLLRNGLPFVIVGLVVTYIAMMLKMSGLSMSLPELALRRILPSDLSMQNPHYEGFGKDGSSYVFDAKTARQDPTMPTHINLDGISARLTEANKSTTDVTATRGTFDHKASVLELFDEIKVQSESGLKAALTRATVTTKTSTIETQEPVNVEFPSGTLTSNAMMIRQKSREIEFTGGVTARLTPQKPDDKSAADTASTAATGLFKASNAPLDITASRLDVKDTAKVAIFTGEVKAVQGEAVMTTPELEVGYEGGAGSGGGTAQPAATPATGASSALSGNVRRIVAKAPVVMTRGPGERVDSTSAEFDAMNETGILLGNVVMTSGADRKAVSDRVDLDQRADTAVLSGNVVVTQGKNELKGRRLFVDNKNGKALLTAPAGAGLAAGRITAKFYQAANAANKQGQQQTNTASKNEPGAGAFGSFKTDPNAPIDIEADQLEMIDSQKTATFRGDVKAVQGDFIIRTAELVANYTGEAGLAQAAASPVAGAATAGKTSAQLTRIQTRSKVTVTSKDGQEASGDWADYDAKANTVTVGGEVGLAKGQNMVRGTRLVIDMTTGESKIDTAPVGTSANPGGGGWLTKSPAPAEPANRGRPSAVFFPNQLKGENGNKKAKDSGQKGGQPQSWDTQSAPEGQAGN